MIKSKTYIATPPGFTIKEQLDDRGLTQKEFAARMEMTEKHISRLLNGEVAMTTEMAIRLEMVLGVPAQFWLNLESIYREKLAKIEFEKNMDEDIEIAKNFPYSQMANLDWVPKTTNKTEKVINLRKFFEVTRLGLLIENPKLNVLYRRMTMTDKADFALMAWAQKAKIEARNFKTNSINIKGLIKNISGFKKMTLETPDIFCNNLTEVLAKNGVSIVFLPHIGGSFLHGATFYDGKKIVIGLTVRGKDADKFWFSFFHELGHIILGHINEEYNDSMEIEADEFARNSLISHDEYNAFINENNFIEEEIIKFSQKMDIDYGIVVGRLQKDGYVPYTKFNHLKTKYSLTN